MCCSHGKTGGSNDWIQNKTSSRISRQAELVFLLTVDTRTEGGAWIAQNLL